MSVLKGKINRRGKGKERGLVNQFGLNVIELTV